MVLGLLGGGFAGQAEGRRAAGYGVQGALRHDSDGPVGVGTALEVALEPRCAPRLADRRPGESARRAVLPQTPVFAFPFRVIEVVMLGLGPRESRGRAEDLRIVHAVLSETDTLHLAERAWATLSGGVRQRVHLARALAQIWPDRQPSNRSGNRYLLFDEPTNNLDLAHQQGIMVSARRLARRGYGVLAVLHDPNLAALYADRICVLDAGRTVADGPPEAVLHDRLFETTFGIRVRVLKHPERNRPVVLPA